MTCSEFRYPNQTARRTRCLTSRFCRQFNSSSAKAMVGNPHDRTAPATTLIEGFGGKLHSYFFAFGDYDGVRRFVNSPTIRPLLPVR